MLAVLHLHVLFDHPISPEFSKWDGIRKAAHLWITAAGFYRAAALIVVQPTASKQRLLAICFRKTRGQIHRLCHRIHLKIILKQKWKCLRITLWHFISEFTEIVLITCCKISESIAYQLWLSGCSLFSFTVARAVNTACTYTCTLWWSQSHAKTHSLFINNLVDFF